MLNSEAVANYFIQKSFDTGIGLTPMKLLKLVYIAHGWHRGYFSENLINDAVQAWRYGPVIPDLYRKVKGYGRRDIDSQSRDMASLVMRRTLRQTRTQSRCWTEFGTRTAGLAACSCQQ